MSDQDPRPEVMNHTEEDAYVKLCRTKRGKLVVHLVEEDTEIHDDEPVCVEAMSDERLEVNEGMV